MNINYLDFYMLKSIFQQHSLFFYKFIITIFFTIDVGFFAFGYLTESIYLKNKIKMVETSFLGIFFCLICYPPFNSVTSTFLGWNQNNVSVAFNDASSPITWSFRIIALIFLFTYASASVALGTKASNLTNRGTVTKFPYNIVRHPAYISKNVFWLLTTIPILLVDFTSPSFVLCDYLLQAFLLLCTYIFWLGIYYFRAIFEEKLLMQDPEYQAYAKKVKYRFIPYII